MLDILKSIIYGIVQGITEWLPISSTGHLILLEAIMPMNVSQNFWDMFLVIIQLGSILAVILLFWNRLWPWGKNKTPKQTNSVFQLWLKIIVGTLPLLIVVPFDDYLEEHLYNYIVVAIMLIVYGVLFIIVENLDFVKHPKIKGIKNINLKTAFLIGCFEALSVIPGTSRSGSTIIGALILGCSRTTAAEFSFFLAIPAMLGASTLRVVKFILSGTTITLMECVILFVGALVAFLVSVYVIKFLLRYIRRHNFVIFGYYRIFLGLIVLLFYMFTH